LEALTKPIQQARWKHLRGVQKLEADDVSFAVEVNDDRLPKVVVVYDNLFRGAMSLD
jgi:hypothetical protein